MLKHDFACIQSERYDNINLGKMHIYRRLLIKKSYNLIIIVQYILEANQNFLHLGSS